MPEISLERMQLRINNLKLLISKLKKANHLILTALRDNASNQAEQINALLNGAFTAAKKAENYQGFNGFHTDLAEWENARADEKCDQVCSELETAETKVRELLDELRRFKERPTAPPIPIPQAASFKLSPIFPRETPAPPPFPAQSRAAAARVLVACLNVKYPGEKNMHTPREQQGTTQASPIELPNPETLLEQAEARKAAAPAGASAPAVPAPEDDSVFDSPHSSEGSNKDAQEPASSLLEEKTPSTGTATATVPLAAAATSLPPEEISQTGTATVPATATTPSHQRQFPLSETQLAELAQFAMESPHAATAATTSTTSEVAPNTTAPAAVPNTATVESVPVKETGDAVTAAVAVAEKSEKSPRTSEVASAAEAAVAETAGAAGKVESADAPVVDVTVKAAEKTENSPSAAASTPKIANVTAELSLDDLLKRLQERAATLSSEKDAEPKKAAVGKALQDLCDYVKSLQTKATTKDRYQADCRTVLALTLQLCQEQPTINVAEYKKAARSLQGHSSPVLQTLGRYMAGLAMLLLVAGLVLAGVGAPFILVAAMGATSLAAGAASGFTLFNNRPTGLAKDALAIAAAQERANADIPCCTAPV